MLAHLLSIDNGPSTGNVKGNWFFPMRAKNYQLMRLSSFPGKKTTRVAGRGQTDFHGYATIAEFNEIFLIEQSTIYSRPHPSTNAA